MKVVSFGLFSALFGVCISLLPSQALADYVSSDGHEYRIQCNANGFVLTSRGPVTRMFEDGANSRPIRQNREVIYFGRSCDASNAIYGQGRWCQANGGFGAELQGISYFFPRQESFCFGEYSYFACSCG
jgi:hypothetical protein